jgi:hypothetical protein
VSQQPVSQQPVSQQPQSGRAPDDATARQSGAVSEDVQPVETADEPETTAQGAPEGVEPDGAGRRDQ